MSSVLMWSKQGKIDLASKKVEIDPVSIQKKKKK